MDFSSSHGVFMAIIECSVSTAELRMAVKEAEEQYRGLTIAYDSRNIPNPTLEAQKTRVKAKAEMRSAHLARQMESNHRLADEFRRHIEDKFQKSVEYERLVNEHQSVLRDFNELRQVVNGLRQEKQEMQTTLEKCVGDVSAIKMDLQSIKTELQRSEITESRVETAKLSLEFRKISRGLDSLCDDSRAIHDTIVSLGQSVDSFAQSERAQKLLSKETRDRLLVLENGKTELDQRIGSLENRVGTLDQLYREGLHDGELDLIFASMEKISKRCEYHDDQIGQLLEGKSSGELEKNVTQCQADIVGLQRTTRHYERRFQSPTTNEALEQIKALSPSMENAMEIRKKLDGGIQMIDFKFFNQVEKLTQKVGEMEEVNATVRALDEKLEAAVKEMKAMCAPSGL